MPDWDLIANHEDFKAVIVLFVSLFMCSSGSADMVNGREDATVGPQGTFPVEKSRAPEFSGHSRVMPTLGDQLGLTPSASG